MNEDIRKQVSETYTKALKESSCCGPSSCCGSDTSSKATLPEKLGYSKDELDAIPEDAAVNSFGCGNPLAFSGVSEGQVVLDLGSGAGIDVLLAASKVGPTGRAIGVDMTGDMIDRARANIAKAGAENAEIRQGIIEELPVEDASVDWVISNCVINLSPEKPRVFAEISRVLRPGGQFSISDIVANDLPDWIVEHMGLYGACVSGAISEDAYLQGLEDAGLKDVKVVNRIAYDANQLRGLIDSGDVPLPDCLPEGFAEKAIEAIVGKVQSIKVTGSK